MENVSANEQENRKRTPASQYSMQSLNKAPAQPLKPAPSSGANGVAKGGYVPGKSNAAHHGVVTPAVRPSSSMSSNTCGTNKRQKLTNGTHRNAEPLTRGRTPSNNSTLPRLASQQAYHMPSQSKNNQGYAALGWGRNPSTIPRSVSQQPRATSSHLGSGTNSQCLPNGRSFNSTSMVPSTSRDPTVKKTTGRIRKESFKPRPSVDVGGRGWKAGFRGVAEEDER